MGRFQNTGSEAISPNIAMLSTAIDALTLSATQGLAAQPAAAATDSAISTGRVFWRRST